MINAREQKPEFHQPNNEGVCSNHQIFFSPAEELIVYKMRGPEEQLMKEEEEMDITYEKGKRWFESIIKEASPKIEQSMKEKEEAEISVENANAKKIDTLLQHHINMLGKEAEEKFVKIKEAWKQSLVEVKKRLMLERGSLKDVNKQRMEMDETQRLTEESESDCDSQSESESQSENEQLVDENERLMQEKDRLMQENELVMEGEPVAKRALVMAVRDGTEHDAHLMTSNQLLLIENENMKTSLIEMMSQRDKIIMDQENHICSLQEMINSLNDQVEREKQVARRAEEEAEKRAETKKWMKVKEEINQDKQTLLQTISKLKKDNSMKAEAAKWAEAVAMREASQRGEAEAKREALEKEVMQLTQRVVEAEETARREKEFSAAIMNMEYEIVDRSETQ